MDLAATIALECNILHKYLRHTGTVMYLIPEDVHVEIVQT